MSFHRLNSSRIFLLRRTPSFSGQNLGQKEDNSGRDDWLLIWGTGFLFFLCTWLSHLLCTQGLSLEFFLCAYMRCALVCHISTSAVSYAVTYNNSNFIRDCAFGWARICAWQKKISHFQKPLELSHENKNSFPFRKEWNTFSNFETSSTCSCKKLWRACGAKYIKQYFLPQRGFKYSYYGWPAVAVGHYEVLLCYFFLG